MEEERLLLNNLSSAEQVARQIMSMSDQKRLLIIGLLWAWWDARNKANAGEKRRLTEEVVYKARSVLIQVQEDVMEEGVRAVRANGQRWIPPSPDIMKINVDAAFWPDERLGAWGFVVHDHHANAVLAGAGRLKVVSNVRCAEAHACIAVLQAAVVHGLQNIVVETDSQTLVKALQTCEYDLAPGGVLFREAKFILSTSFSSSSIIHGYRSCNMVAHELARVGRHRDPDHPVVWIHPLPAFVNNLLVSDFATT